MRARISLIALVAVALFAGVLAQPSFAKPIDQTRIFYQLGDLSAHIRALPKASPARLSRLSARVRLLNSKLDATVARRARECVIRGTERVADRSANKHRAIQRDYVKSMRKIRARYHRAMRRARDLPPRKTDALRLRAKERRADRKNAVFAQRARRLGQLRDETEAAYTRLAERCASKRDREQHIAHIQKQELRYQLRALRNRS